MEKIIITKADADKRLDVFLSDYLKKSRNSVQKLITAGKVSLGERILSNHYWLQANDEITLAQKKIVKRKVKPQAIIEQLQVITTTPDYIVINKPAGLIVHPTAGSKTYTLVDWLLTEYPDLARVGDDLLRPGIIHRLDKDVSGLMVIARNQDSFDSLKQQFKERTVYKQYQALVHGVIAQDNDILRFAIARAKSGKMAARPKGAQGRHAVTELSVQKRFLHFTLLQVVIKTGRTHQIRVHLTAYNHPIVGDKLYNNKVSAKANIKIKLNRLFLVATKLEFTDLKNKRQEFVIDLPKDLQELLKTIK